MQITTGQGDAIEDLPSVLSGSARYNFHASTSSGHVNGNHSIVNDNKNPSDLAASLQHTCSCPPLVAFVGRLATAAEPGVSGRITTIPNIWLAATATGRPSAP
eukprot:1139599-Pelagomonas_calceolata.AAC.5